MPIKARTDFQPIYRLNRPVWAEPYIKGVLYMYRSVFLPSAHALECG